MKYIINEDQILYSPLGHEAVVFDKKTNEYITLNETMNTVFQCLVNGDSTEVVLEKFLETYNIDKDACQMSIDKSLQTLLDKKFIKVV
jgi:hypothetical protein